MASSPAASARLSRRRFLAASAAGAALLAAGCTADPADESEPVTPAQADQLADQVAVQESLVAAYAAAAGADAALAAELADLEVQAGEQLDRLRAAAPGPGGSSPASGTTPGPVGDDPLTWLRQQVAAAAESHAAACLEQSGGRAALLGSIAAGLRGQVEALT